MQCIYTIKKLQVQFYTYIFYTLKFFCTYTFYKAINWNDSQIHSRLNREAREVWIKRQHVSGGTWHRMYCTSPATTSCRREIGSSFLERAGVTQHSGSPQFSWHSSQVTCQIYFCDLRVHQTGLLHLGSHRDESPGDICKAVSPTEGTRAPENGASGTRCLTLTQECHPLWSCALLEASSWSYPWQTEPCHFCSLAKHRGQ